MQLLHQGTHSIPVDFITETQINKKLKNNKNYLYNHIMLISNCLAQSQALMSGNKNKEKNIFKICPGNKPNTTIMFKKLSPKILGNLIALYEHKVFVQGIIWEIDSFDQWGVEFGKTINKKISSYIFSNKKNNGINTSTSGLIKFLKNNLT